MDMKTFTIRNEKSIKRQRMKCKTLSCLNLVVLSKKYDNHTKK